MSPASVSERDDRPIGLVDRRSRLRPPGSQGGSLRGDLNCLTVNALAHRAYTARRGNGRRCNACPSACPSPSKLLLPSFHVGDDDQSDRLMEASKCGVDIKTDGVCGPNRFSLEALTAGTDRFPPPADERGAACSSDSVRVFLRSGRRLDGCRLYLPHHLNKQTILRNNPSPPRTFGNMWDSVAALRATALVIPWGPGFTPRACRTPEVVSAEALWKLSHAKAS